MNIKEQKSKTLEKTFAISITPLEFAMEKEKAIAKLNADTAIQGFRKGKAPAHIIEQRYSSSIKAEILENAAQNALKEILKDTTIHPLTRPSITDVKQTDTQLDFSITFEVFPTIKHPDFKKIKLEKNILALTEDDINKSLEELSEQHKERLDTDRDTVQMGDAITMDFEGKKDGIPFKGGKSEGYVLSIGSKSFIPGFEEQLVGKKLKETCTITLTFPEQYHSKDLAGQEVVFTVTIHKIQEEKKHPINDELAKKLGLETLDDLKKSINERYQEQYNDAQFQGLRKKLLEEMLKHYKIEMPEQALNKEKEALWHEYEHYRQHMEEHKQGMHQDHHHDHDNDPFKDKTEKEIKSMQEEQAIERLERFFIMEDIAMGEKITVSETDIRTALWQEAGRYPGQEAAVLDMYGKNKEAMENLKSSLREEKILKHILSKVSYQEKKITIAEIMKEQEEKANAKKLEGKKE